MSTDKPPPQKKSRPITMALLGAVTLCSCCCCLAPDPRGPDDGPAGDSGGTNFDDPREVAAGTPTTAADGTPTTGSTGRTTYNQTSHSGTGRSFYGGPFWLPLFFGGSTSRGYSGGPGVGAPSRSPAPGGGVSTGGFGGTGRSMGGAGGGSSSS